MTPDNIQTIVFLAPYVSSFSNKILQFPLSNAFEKSINTLIENI